MAVLVISLMVGFAAAAVLLGCLKGFSQALKHKRLSALLVGVGEPGSRVALGNSKTLVEFPPRQSRPGQDPAPQRISSRTASLIGLAILLGSRGVTGDPQAASVRREHDPRLQFGEKTRVPGVQPVHNS
jgi:hypothetical protein